MSVLSSVNFKCQKTITLQYILIAHPLLIALCQLLSSSFIFLIFLPFPSFDSLKNAFPSSPFPDLAIPPAVQNQVVHLRESTFKDVRVDKSGN